MLKFMMTVLVLFFAPIGFAQENSICAEAVKTIDAGDVVFISNHNLLFRRVESDTKTWTSHVGVAFKNDLDKWVVYESTWPKSKITPLCEFLARSFEDRIEIKRFSTPLTSSQLRVMKMAATRQLGLSYDQGFDYSDSKTSFCSKYVYNTYLAAQIQMGNLQTFQQVFDENPEMDLSFWKFWFFGKIPYDRVTISPAIQIRDLKFHSVFKHNVP